MTIFLIDGIGPFFRQYKKEKINWSKVPFHTFPNDEQKYRLYFDQVTEDMEIFSAKVAQVGYNSISLDDVAHLAPDIWIEPEVNEKIQRNQVQYRQLFSICSHHKLDVYLTMDILSFTPLLRQNIGNCHKTGFIFLKRQIESIFTSFPEVKGIIVRIGECDGKDVKGEFKSELFLKTSKQVNKLLRYLLPVFAQHQKYLILRSWTVGAYQVGDFLWHRKTLKKVLHRVTSDFFILSLKYGESDFFRYLPLNKHFFRVNVKTLVELQARREYEGCGEYPSFIGWDYQQYNEQLRNNSNVAGISVWCQTGGWLPFRRLTYLEKSGIWNEANSYACIKIFKEQKTAEQAIIEFADEIGCRDKEELVNFFRLNDEVIKKLLYIEKIAGQKLFFRRVRIPPLLSVFWNNIFINHSVKKVLSSLVESGDSCITEGYAALEKIEHMVLMAKQLELPAEDIEYMYDTFTILALAREYYFLPYSDELRQRIQKSKKQYKKKYPKGTRPRYRIKTNYTPFKIKRFHLRWFFRLFFRQKRGYRVLDFFLTLHFLGFVYRAIITINPKLVPKFARKHAMGIETIFK